VKSIFFLAFALLLGAVAHAQSAHFSGALAILQNVSLTNPYGMAIDASGNIYVADNAENSISLLTPLGVFSADFLSGDGSPWGIAVDASGNLYITDRFANKVVKQTLRADGSHIRSVLPVSGLGNPLGIAVDAYGNVYIADSANNRVVKLAPSGSTYTQSTVPTSTLQSPWAVAVDGFSNLYIADTSHFRVLKEVPSGKGYTESVVATLKNFASEAPIGVAADGAGDVFILEYLDDASFAVIKETLSGGVYTQSALPSYGENPYGIAADAAGDVFTASPGSGRIVKVFGPILNYGPVQVGNMSSPIAVSFTFDKQTTMPSAFALEQGFFGEDFSYTGAGTCATQKPGHVFQAGDSCSMNVVFTPYFPGNRIGAAILFDQVSDNPLAVAYLSGTGVGPQVTFPPGNQSSIAGGLKKPSGLAVDGRGDVFVTENTTGNVYEFFVNGTYSKRTVASGVNDPVGVAIDGAGNLYVATSSGVYKETPRSLTLDGSFTQSQIVTDLPDLNGIAVDAQGNLYLTSSVLGDVHKETLQANGSYAESAIGYGITRPRGVAVDARGDIFILNAAGNHLYVETPQANGSYLQALFTLSIAEPESITTDGHGNLYIADPSHGEIDKLTPQTNGSYLESITASGLPAPTGVGVDAQGNVFYAEGTSSGRLFVLYLVDPPSLGFATTKVGVTSAPQYVMVSNIGNAAVGLPAPVMGTNASVPAGFVLDAASTCPIVGPGGVAGSLDGGSSCYYEVRFMPEARASFTGNLVLTLSPDYLQQQDVPLSGASTSLDATRTSMRVSPNPVKLGRGVTVIVTVTDTVTPSTLAQGAVTLTDSVSGPLNGGAAVALSSGKATLAMIPSIAGAHTIAAHYGGVDDSFLGSTGQLILTVEP
jgi:sugar lactone lactonase YvrE